MKMGLPEAHDKFCRYFGVSLNPFIDGLMTAVKGGTTIDVFKFDDWLHKQHGDYENEGFSMSDILAEKYGKDADDFIESLL